MTLMQCKIQCKCLSDKDTLSNSVLHWFDKTLSPIKWYVFIFKTQASLACRSQVTDTPWIFQPQTWNPLYTEKFLLTTEYIFKAYNNIIITPVN